MIDHTRRQTTLFLKEQSLVETFRRRFNPVQASLIAPHVTLCREDEVPDWDDLAQRLRSIAPRPITLHFGDLKRDGDLLMLTCTSSTEPFHHLRADLLDRTGFPARVHEPHITLIHPRNGFCTDEAFAEAASAFRPFTHTFDEVSFIQQVNGGIWTVLDTFRLA